jgi:predicted DsbA family dithiol-disulfide isomerase
MAKFTFEIDVYADPICPWCYLGKEALDRAMDTYTAQHPEAEFKLSWKPYLLWPNARVSGMCIQLATPFCCTALTISSLPLWYTHCR